MDLQTYIRFARRQRDLAQREGFKDVATFWENELQIAYAKVPAVEATARRVPS